MVSADLGGAPPSHARTLSSAAAHRAGAGVSFFAADAAPARPRPSNEQAVYSGPAVKYLSRNGETQMEFRALEPFEPEQTERPAPAPRLVCAVTGLPAKYRDPRSGRPYANAEAFKVGGRRP